MLGQETETGEAHMRAGEAHMRAVLKVRGTSYVSLIHSAWHKLCLLKERRGGSLGLLHQ